MTIKFIKLISGEELVADATENGDKVTITKPARITLHYDVNDPQSQPKSRVDIFAPHTKDLTFTLNRQHILVMEEPHPSLATYYTDTFLKGIPNE